MDKKTLTALREHFKLNYYFRIKQVRSGFCNIILDKFYFILARLQHDGVIDEEFAAFVYSKLKRYCPNPDMDIIFDALISCVFDITKVLNRQVWSEGFGTRRFITNLEKEEKAIVEARLKKTRFYRPLTSLEESQWVDVELDRRYFKRHNITVTPKEFLYVTAVITGRLCREFELTCKRFYHASRTRPYLLDRDIFNLALKARLIQRELVTITLENEEYYINFLLNTQNKTEQP